MRILKTKKKKKKKNYHDRMGPCWRVLHQRQAKQAKGYGPLKVPRSSAAASASSEGGHPESLSDTCAPFVRTICIRFIIYVL